MIKIAAGQTAELGTILETIKYGCTLQLALMKIIPITMNILKKISGSSWDIANFMNIDPFVIEIIINHKMQQT